MALFSNLTRTFLKGSNLSSQIGLANLVAGDGCNKPSLLGSVPNYAYGGIASPRVSAPLARLKNLLGHSWLDVHTFAMDAQRKLN